MVLDFKSTKDIKISKRIIDRVVGQEEAVEVAKKAASQRRHMLLIGEPGTGKSMIGLGLAELLPREKLLDILAFQNQNDENQPLIRTVTAGKGREIVMKARMLGIDAVKNQSVALFIIALVVSFLPYYFWKMGEISDVIFAASMITGMVFLIGFLLFLNFSRRPETRPGAPKVIVDNFGNKQAPFFDATGAHAGALLGDVLHDPFQSGGLGTPAHERVVAGMIHKAHMGVLFIDEIATLKPSTQQELLTALQEGKFSITGQSERSAGAMVRTEAVPCNFIMIAAGNMETMKYMHPALRSRIRGYGYEVYMKDTMPDNPENRMKIARFVAQEIIHDGNIPHFSMEAVLAIIEEAKRRANRKGHLTLRLRELGGIVRAAGDLGKEEGAEFVRAIHVKNAKKYARTLEQQLADKLIERRKEYEVIMISGEKVGRVNGLAVLGGETGIFSGIILPIEAQVSPGGKSSEIMATGKLGDIAKEAVKNVSAIIKNYFGEDIKGKYDLYVQFLQTYEGVEGDSASIAVATAVISAIENVPVRQDTAMTGSLTVRGEVLPIGGVSAKVEAAIESGLKQVIVPRSNLNDIVVEKAKLDKIKVIPVEHIVDVLKEALVWKGKEQVLKKIIKGK